MDILAAVGDCLRDKEEYFLQYEVLTEKMNICEPEELSHYITARGDLANKIDDLDEQMYALVDEFEDPSLLQDALENQGLYDDYPPELLGVYNQAARIFAVINRIYQQDPRIMERVRAIQAELLEKIKESTNTRKVSKFIKSAATTPSTGVYFNKSTN